MTMGHYLRSMKQLTNQWTPTNFRDERRQRLYLKDIDCPPEWQERLSKVMPPNVFYMNDNVDQRGSKGRGDDPDMFQEARTVAPAGDLMSSLPEQMRAQNLMCYIGHEGTYTPAHKEMCASLGQNIMVDASSGANEEKPGSSIWFMTETKDREVVREYFLSMLGHDIEIEKHFAQINAWKKATFPVYIVEQRVGDFILVPPLAPHQVWNRGTRTIKIAWNRTTVQTLEMALREALPKARLVCRDEQYKNKAIIFYTLQKYYHEMQEMEKSADIGLLGFGTDLIRNSTRMKQMAADFKSLFALFTEILVDEMFATKEKDVEFVEFDSCITCSYCRANVFNRFLTCKHCVRQLVNGDEDTYDVCMECYAMGRSCLCISGLTWCEQWKWSHLVDRYEDWRAMIVKNDGFVSFEHSPLPLELARNKTGKKSVAQICQEQLKRRPWKDLTKIDQPQVEEDSDIEIGENGRPLKKNPKRKRKKGDVYHCHVCGHKDHTYRLAFCSNEGCPNAYCFGVLYRAFDLMPQDVLQTERWECPRCLRICNCASCRRGGNTNPYIPKNTLLGHDTRPIADDRSVESLVDFGKHNLGWLRNVGEEGRSVSSKRIQRLQQAAESEKARQADLAHEVPVLPDKDLAESLDAATNGHAQPGELGANGITGHGQTGDQPRAAETDMSLRQDQSQYPDPTVLGHERMLGMGYYEQDDSPDKILFDPYQAPTVEDMVVEEEPEPMSEYLKKQLRLAKRRARNDDDNDPDFAAPRSHGRKKAKVDHQPHATQQDVLDNMDPALFEDEIMLDAPGDVVTPTEDEVPTAAEPARGGAADEAGEDAEPRPYSPNRPALRHARPKAPYLEETQHEDDDFDEDEVFVPKSKRPPEGITDFDPDASTKNPLDLASAAIFSMGLTTAGTPQRHDPTATPQAEKKKPGRKPGRPRASTGAASTSQAVEASAPGEAPKRRGRPPRVSVPAEPEIRGEIEDSGSTDSLDIDAQLEKQLNAFGDDGEFVREASSPTPSVHPALQANISKRRGRPPRSSLPQPEPAPTQSASPFMSMAERMKLKGKKIKITERKSLPATAVPHPSIEDYSTAEMSSRAASITQSPVPRSVPAQTSTRGGSRGGGRGRGRGWGRGGGKGSTRATSASASVDVSDDSISNGYDPAAEEEVISSGHSSSPPFHNSESSRESSGSPPPRPATKQMPPPASAFEPAPPIRLSESVSTTPSSASEQYRPPTLPPKPAGPTIVRLMDSEEEFESGTESESVSENEAANGNMSSDSDSDDEDIPAQPQQRSKLAFRGGLASRGRGRGRGRGAWRGAA